MNSHKHEFTPFAEGKSSKHREGKWVLTSFIVACMCGAIKTVKVKTVNGIKVEKIIL